MRNPKWDVWLYRSITKFFADRLTDYPTFIEGQERSTSQEPIRLEIRCDGPFQTKLSRDNYKLWTEVNILVIVAEQVDRLKIHEISGIVASKFEECLPIYKYGDPDDDAENTGDLLTVFKLRPRSGSEDVIKTYYGKLDPKTNIHQATLEGHYYGYLTGV